MKSQYFPHDHNARGDEKIIRLLRKNGWEGYGLFWALIEKLYEAGGRLVADYDTLAYDLRTEAGKLKAIVEEYDLFHDAGGKIGSRSVDRRLAEIQGIRDAARQKGIKSGELRRNRTAVEPVLNSGSTGVEQERKKERKKNESASLDSKCKGPGDGSPCGFVAVKDGLCKACLGLVELQKSEGVR